MEKPLVLILLVLAFLGCQLSPKDVNFELVAASSGAILDDNKAYESHDHKWKSSNGQVVSVNLLKFTSKDEARSFLGVDELKNMSGSKNYDGRLINNAANDTTSSITLWKGNKLIEIKSSTLELALAFENCCSEREFNNF